MLNLTNPDMGEGVSKVTEKVLAYLKPYMYLILLSYFNRLVRTWVKFLMTTVRASLLAAACIFFYPISKDHLYTVTFGLMYGLYPRAASNQERLMMACVR